MSTIFYEISIIHQMVTLQKPWEMFFISSKKLFSFTRYSMFCISVFPFFLSVSHCFRDCDVVSGLSKNLITHFIWYLEKNKSYDIENSSIDIVLNKKHFYWKTDPSLILVNNPKRSLHARSFLKVGYFERELSKKSLKS